MPKYFATFITLVGLIALPSHAFAKKGDENGGSKLEIKKFRFNARYKNSSERLVLEFHNLNRNHGTPTVTVTTNATTKEASIQVDNASLVGAIPEAAINDSYVSRSKYLGPVSVNTDAPTGGFSIRASMKEEATKVEAFWLKNPLRLVLDAGTGASPSMATSNDNPTAGYNSQSMEEPMAAPMNKTHKRTMASTPMSHDTFLCFPASSQVEMAVTFRGYRRNGTSPKIKVNTDGNPAGPDSEAIVCYPKSAQVTASIVYESSPVADLPPTVDEDTSNNLPSGRSVTPAAPLFNSSPRTNAAPATMPAVSTTPPKSSERTPSTAMTTPPSNAHVVDSSVTPPDMSAQPQRTPRPATPALLPPMK